MVMLAATLVACSLVAQKSDILFIFADDLSFEAIGASGNAVVQTPNIDRLADEGTYFTNAYNMGSWTPAVCLASRTMINTGRSVWHAQDLHKSFGQSHESRPILWSERMANAGYETYLTGKWHVSVAPEDVFDYVRHVRPGMPLDSFPDQRPEGYHRPIEGKPDPWSPYDRSKGGFWSGGTHWSEVVASDAEDFMLQASGRTGPFFMYLAFNAAHDPRQSPKEFVDRYSAESIPIPENYQPIYPYREEMGSGEGLRDEILAPFPRTEYAVRVHRSEYYAVISHLDAQIGRILKALEASGRRDRTYIFFTADHGLACGHHGLLGKQNMYEHSMKAPLIVLGPGLPGGQRRKAPVYIQDIMATTLELAGAEKPEGLEFESLLPLIGDPALNGKHGNIYGAYTDKQRMIRVGSLKLILYPEASRLRLFDLASDPDEIKDLAGDPRYWSSIRSLFAELLQKQEQLSDTLDLRKAFPELCHF